MKGKVILVSIVEKYVQPRNDSLTETSDKARQFTLNPLILETD